MTHHEIQRILTCFVIFYCLFLSCKDSNDTLIKSDSLIKYEELQGINLIGKHLLKHNSEYPYITIQLKKNGEKVIKYYFSKNECKTESYTFNKYLRHWATTYSIIGDTGNIIINKTISKDSIITLEYEYNIKKIKKLSSIAIAKNYTEWLYVLKIPTQTCVGVFSEKLLLKDMYSVNQSKVSLRSGILSVIYNRHFFDHTIVNDTIRYDIGNHSIDWWFTFRDFLLPINERRENSPPLARE